MFFQCSNSSEGDGFVVHHKKCPSDFTFDGYSKKCNINPLKANRNAQTKTLFKKKQEIAEFFHCSHTGLFPGIELYVQTNVLSAQIA